jgi:hypothetical protein
MTSGISVPFTHSVLSRMILSRMILRGNSAVALAGTFKAFFRKVKSGVRPERPART